MADVDAAAPRRRFGLKAPITGLVLIGLVTYASYWGWERAFGDTAPAVVASGCPTPSVSTTATATPSGSAVSAVQARALRLDRGGVRVLGVGSRLMSATTAPPVTPAPSPTPVFLAAEDVVVNVYNATSSAGLAANTAAVLRDLGFDIAEVSNAADDDLVPEVAQIRGATAESPGVRLLVQYVPGAVIIPDGRSDDTVDLVLGDQFESLGDPALVTPVPVPSSLC